MSARAALLVAETGGHLEQLVQLQPRLSPEFDNVTYVTSLNPQSRSVLAGRRVHFVPRVPPRDWRTAARTLRTAQRHIRLEEVTDVVSTGSAVAVPYLVAARALGVNAHYIESAARTTGPSLAGRILQRVPGVNVYSQYPTWAKGRWRYSGSVLDGYRSEVSERAPRLARRVVVTLGTMAQYPFSRAVEAILRVLPSVAAPDCEVFWQVGSLRSDLLPGRSYDMVPPATLRERIERADLVFAHAGVGSCLGILDAGRMPVLLPRLKTHGEHVDDHQLLISSVLHKRELAVGSDPDVLSTEMVHRAMRRKIVREGQPPHFVLSETPRPRRRFRNSSTSNLSAIFASRHAPEPRS